MMICVDLCCCNHLFATGDFFEVKTAVPEQRLRSPSSLEARVNGQ